MDIFLELVQRVDDGESFYIDFQKRTMKVGHDFLIKNGEYDHDRQLTKLTSMGIDKILSTIEELYHNYKYSLPSERSDSKRHKYFKALPIEQLDDFHLLYPVKREGVQARLEGFILCAILNGDFVWDEATMGKWFWLSKNDPDLVILRKWIEK